MLFIFHEAKSDEMSQVAMIIDMSFSRSRKGDGEK